MSSVTEAGQGILDSSPIRSRTDSSIDAHTAPVALMPELWSALPSNVLEVVASKLDFSTMISSRLVCKSWDKMVTSPGYCPPNPAAKGVLLGHNSMENSLAVHNRCKNSWSRWYYDPLAASTVDLTKSQRAAYLKRLCSGDQPCGINMVGTAGGLLCFRTSGVFNSYPNHIVTNPVLKTFRVLPSMLSNSEISNFRAGFRVWWGLAAMLFDQVTRGYKLVMVGYSMDEVDPIHEPEISRFTTMKATQIYDSLSNEWSLTYQHGKINGGWMSFMRSCNKSVLYKGFLFVITGMDMWVRGLSVMIFSMEGGRWIKQHVASVAEDCGEAYGSLAVSNDELYMVAKEATSIRSSITYWKLSVNDLPTAWKNGSLNRDGDSVWRPVRRINLHAPQFPMPWEDTKYWFSMGHNGCFYFIFRIHDAAAVVIHDIDADAWTTVHFQGANGIGDASSFFNVCVFQPSFSQV